MADLRKRSVVSGTDNENADRELVHAVLRGDPQALREFDERFGVLVHRMVSGSLRSEENRERHEELYILCLEHLLLGLTLRTKRYSGIWKWSTGRSALLPWLDKTGIPLVAWIGKVLRHFLDRPAIQAYILGTDTVRYILRAPPSKVISLEEEALNLRTTDPWSDADRKDVWRAVNEALDRLSEREEQVFRLRLEEDLSAAEIAERIRELDGTVIEVGSVDAYLSKARKKLRNVPVIKKLYRDYIGESVASKPTGGGKTRRRTPGKQ